MAKQRARAATVLGAVSFVAVGAIAWIGLEAVRAPANPTEISASALSQGTPELAAQSLTGNQPQGQDNSVNVASAPLNSNGTTQGAQETFISRAEQERAAARKAILKNAGTDLALLEISEVEQLINNPDQTDPILKAARLAILQNAGDNLELLYLSEVEELAGVIPRTTQPTSELSDLPAATQTLSAPELDQASDDLMALEAEGDLQPSTAPEETIVASAGGNCIDDLRNFAASQTILFGSGSAELLGSELPTLRKLGKMAEACDGALVHVTGHSDSSGTDIINLALSWQRADNTVATLAALGIDTTKFEPVGFGARSPSAQGDSSDEELNRRVEFVIFEATGSSN